MPTHPQPQTQVAAIPVTWPRSAAGRACLAGLFLGGSVWIFPESPTLRGWGQSLAILVLGGSCLTRPSPQPPGFQDLLRHRIDRTSKLGSAVMIPALTFIGFGASLTWTAAEHGKSFAGLLIALWAWNLSGDLRSPRREFKGSQPLFLALDDGIAVIGWVFVVTMLVCAVGLPEANGEPFISNRRAVWWLRGLTLAAGLLLTWREASRRHDSMGWALIGFSLLFRISLIAPYRLSLNDGFASLCVYQLLRNTRARTGASEPLPSLSTQGKKEALCRDQRRPRLGVQGGRKALEPVGQSESEQSRSTPIGTLVLLALAFGVGGWLRIDGVGPAFLFGDELHSLFGLSQGYGHLMSHFSSTGSGLALPLLQRALVDGFGNNHWAIRAPAWIPGLLLLPVTWWAVRKWLGEGIALGATWLVAASPLLIFYSRFARSYALVTLLVLLLLERVQNAASRHTLSIGSFSFLVGLAAVIPFVHPTALGSVVPICLAGACAAAWESAGSGPILRRPWVALLGVLPLAGLLCIALHWPARESLWAFVSAKTTQVYSGAFGPVDIARLVTGGDVLSILLATLALVGALSVTGRWGWRAAPLLAATTGPVLVIALTQPYGDAYAYARYIIAAVVPFFILAVVGIHWVLALLSPRPRGLTGAVSIGLAALILGSGPLPPSLGLTPQHANTYLGLRELTAFDRPWPGTPGFYQNLPDIKGRRPRLLEIPALTTRTRHLYRIYQRTHQSPTLLGPLPSEFPMIPSGPYRALSGPWGLDPAEIDYVIVHRNIASEVARYWEWVYGVRDPDGDEALLARHAQYGGLLPRPSPVLQRELEKSWGPPVYQDDDLVVYRLSQSESRPE